ncbi:restriction endonuclease subunit S [Anoxybacillus flavithermus]|uniref:Restriction endonuclease subunit S n=1 Tax=Anoxybacillus flavithermus TaxID=33934 RepID=A0AAX1ZZF8_9BACL|nr:restriction endonuclease subunit S [Anoxybacillus flavithermus]RWU13369.1 restriction endonuclease subunit S [Anoxybacillus flavithermus]
MNVKKYHSLKESGVEWIDKIPAHWELRRIGQLFKFRNEKVSDEEYMPLSVTKDGVVPQLENVAKTMHNENRKKVLKGDIVINSRSDRRGSSGLAMLDGSCSLINHVLEPRVELEGKYIHYLFKSVPFCDEYYRWGTGIVDDLWSTQKDRMSQIQIPFPPINEQKSIARFLDHKINSMAKLKKMLEEKINKLKEYRSSLITQAVTKGLDPNVPMKDSGIEWLGEVPGHWSVSKIKYLAHPTAVKVGTRFHGSYIGLENIESSTGKLIGSMNIAEITGEALLCRRSDVLYSKLRPYLKKCITAEKEYACTTELIILKPNMKVIPDFLKYLLISDKLTSYIDSTTYGAKMPRTNWDVIGNVLVYIPPLDEQSKIVSFIDDKLNLIDNLMNKLNRELHILDTYRSSLITAAVTGQIDVSDWKEAEEELETIL